MPLKDKTNTDYSRFLRSLVFKTLGTACWSVPHYRPNLCVDTVYHHASPYVMEQMEPENKGKFYAKAYRLVRKHLTYKQYHKLTECNVRKLADNGDYAEVYRERAECFCNLVNKAVADLREEFLNAPT